MVFSHEWVQSFFKKTLPKSEELASLLSLHSFEAKSGNEGKTIDVDVLPNRASDCLCHRGIAKEISALLDIPFSDIKNQEHTPDNTLPVVIDDERCRRYSAMRITACDSKAKTPEYIKRRLREVGERPIHPIVDITNYVLWEFGIPLHAFDASQIKDGIHVRSSKKGEVLHAVTGEVITLPENSIVISDRKGTTHALAGIRGGTTGAIHENTVDILLEAAHFDATTIRKTSRECKCMSSASIRFSNNPSQHLVPIALWRATQLIEEITKGVVSGYTDCIKTPPLPKRRVGVSIQEINALLGTTIKEKEVIDVFNRLSFEHSVVHPQEEIVRAAKSVLGVPYKWGASVLRDAPSFFDCSSFTSWCALVGGYTIPRVSINQAAALKEVKEEDLKDGDLIFSYNEDTKVSPSTFQEEGYTRWIPHETTPINHVGVIVGKDVIHAMGAPESKIVREPYSAAESFKEGVTYRRFITDERRFVITVPMERTDIHIREDVIEEVARIIGYNEIAKKDTYNEKSPPPVVDSLYAKISSILDSALLNGFSEIMTPVFVKKGEVELKSPPAEDKRYLRPSLVDGIKKSLTLNAHNAELLGVDQIRLIEIGTVFKKEGEEIRIGVGIKNIKGGTKQKDKKEVFDELLHTIRSDTGLSLQGVLSEDGVCEMTVPVNGDNDTDEKLPLRPIPLPSTPYKPFSVYPFVLRDIAVLVPKKVRQEAITSLIEKNAGPLLIRIRMFDTFQKGEDTSFAYHLVFQSEEKTLTSETVAERMSAVEQAVNKKGWIVR